MSENNQIEKKNRKQTSKKKKNKIKENENEYDKDKIKSQEENKEKEKDIKVKKVIEPVIVNESIINKPRILMPSKLLKKPIPTIKIIYIYRREKHQIIIKQNLKIYQLKEKICEELYLLQRDYDIYFKEELINDNNLNDNIMIYLNNKNKDKIKYFEVKKKKQNYDFLPKMSQKTYSNKVKVNGVTNLKDFYSKIEFFFQNCLFEKDFLCEPIAENNYLVSFTFPDLAFDFHRYLFLLKATNELYKNITFSFILEKSNLEQHIKYIKKKREEKGTSISFTNNSLKKNEKDEKRQTDDSIEENINENDNNEENSEESSEESNEDNNNENDNNEENNEESNEDNNNENDNNQNEIEPYMENEEEP